MRQLVRNDNHGFTLIEFLVSIVILMVGLLGLLQVVNVSLNYNSENKMRNEAITLADQLMATQRILPFSAVQTKNSTCSITYGGVRFARYSVNRVVTSTTATTKTVQISTSWRVKNKKMQHFLTSLITDIPMLSN